MDSESKRERERGKRERMPRSMKSETESKRERIKEIRREIL